MRSAWCLAVLIVLLIVLAVCVAKPGGAEGLRPGRGNRLWPWAATGYYWNREAWPFRRWNRWGSHTLRGEPPRSWARPLPSYPGYAAPLEQSLLPYGHYDYYEFLRGFPPPPRVPFG